VYRTLDARLQTLASQGGSETRIDAMSRLRDLLPDCGRRARELARELETLAGIADRLAQEMDFTTLYDHRRKLLIVGYDAGAKQPVTACYDLLASEARIAAFVAIAKGEIPQESWFRLGRGHTVWEGETVLASWTGTMFEYLMPALWMRLYPNTLLDRSARAAVRIQQIYARKHRVPWGISESGWCEKNAEGHYQYRAFGIPQIALKGGDAPRLVISPYSAALALMVDPETALANLSRQASLGWTASCGFYESVDYGSPKRRYLPWRKGTVVRMWMAHHQGMSMLALANWLTDGAFVSWFHSEPRVQATELLLQEKPLRAKPMASVRPDISRIVRVQKWKPAV
jgi:cyclic beta-1,2-glucan synthetase